MCSHDGRDDVPPPGTGQQDSGIRAFVSFAAIAAAIILMAF